MNNINNINNKINIPQNTPVIGSKSSMPVNDGVKADEISISDQKDDSHLKENRLKKLSLNAGGNNINTPQTSSESENPQVEAQNSKPKFTLKVTKKNISYKGTCGDDKVNISQSKNGNLIVNYNGHEKSFNKAEKLSFDLGEGNNFFFADPNVEYDLNVKTGNGNNNITTGKGNDFIQTGNGNNIISSGDEYTTASYEQATNYKQVASNIIQRQTSSLFRGDTIIVGDGNNIINSGAGCDDIKAGNGNNIIDSGKDHDEITVGDGDNIIKGGKGDDDINVGTGNNKIYGGAGNDLIITGNQSSVDKLFGKKNDGNNLIYGGNGNDIIISKGTGINRMYGGDGNDYLQGGPASDYIYGGDGNDIIYGLDGNDYLYGGAGNDYINGGNGNDIIKGGNGKDILLGGKGTDRISEGTGNNILIDDATIKNSISKVYTSDSKNSNLGKSIKIEGDDEFKARVESDLETLRALPSGRKMLEELDKTGKTTTIKPLDLRQNNGNASAADESKAIINPNGTANAGSDTIISYNPSFQLGNYSDENLPPLGALFHEMTHAYNMATGTMLHGFWVNTADDIKKDASEHQAVGLPINNLYSASHNPELDKFDIDNIDIFSPEYDEYLETPSKIWTPTTQAKIHHPDGTISYNNPEGISENDLRTDLNLAPRTRY